MWLLASSGGLHSQIGSRLAMDETIYTDLMGIELSKEIASACRAFAHPMGYKWSARTKGGKWTKVLVFGGSATQSNGNRFMHIRCSLEEEGGLVGASGLVEIRAMRGQSTVAVVVTDCGGDAMTQDSAQNAAPAGLALLKKASRFLAGAGTSAYLVHSRAIAFVSKEQADLSASNSTARGALDPLDFMHPVECGHVFGLRGSELGGALHDAKGTPIRTYPQLVRIRCTLWDCMLPVDSDISTARLELDTETESSSESRAQLNQPSGRLSSLARRVDLPIGGVHFSAALNGSSLGQQ